MNNTHKKIEDWPEIIYSVSKYKELEGHTQIVSFDAPVNKCLPYVEYIRADIAKEREAKLIAATTIVMCFPLSHKVELEKHAIDSIYKEAGLEELK